MTNELILFAIRLSETPIEDKDIKAGWTALILVLLLVGAVVVLGFSLRKQLRKTREAKAEGVYDRHPRDGSPRNDPAD